MENVFIDIASKKINKLFWSTSVSLDAILEKLEDLMVENDTLTEKVEDLEEEIREIKADREENYTPNSINYYIDLGLRESDFH